MSIFLLKCIAVFTMILDHLTYFFPDKFPIVFHWAGRISAPIFIFCLAHGLAHTSSRKHYLSRIYIGSIVMAAGNFILNQLFYSADSPLVGNIFTTLFIIGFIVSLAEADIKLSKKVISFILFVLIQLVVLFIGIRIIGAITFNSPIEHYSYLVSLGTLLPNVFYCEGEIFYVILGLLLYKSRDSKRLLFIIFAGYSLIYISLAAFNTNSIVEIFTKQYEWMIIAAIPFILSYNGTSGKKVKYFFYSFYPIHMWLLFLIRASH